MCSSKYDTDQIWLIGFLWIQQIYGFKIKYEEFVSIPVLTVTSSVLSQPNTAQSQTSSSN